MNSSNFNKFIEDFSTINSSNTNDFERILRKHPYFQTAALFLAKSNPIQHNTQTAALRSADRRVLRSWLDEEYKKELEREKQELEAKQAALEIENDENKEDLDINTESINAFDKLVGTSTIIEQKEEELESKSEDINQEIVENTLQTNLNKENEEVESKNIPTNSFFDDLENTENTTGNSDVNFFDEVDEINKNETEELIFKEQSDINEPLITDSEIPATTTDANFFDEIEETEESIFKEQSDINESLKTDSEIPATTTDANFFDEVDAIEEPIFEEKDDINESLKTDLEIPTTTTDSNFFDEVDSDDKIFGDAQKDLDNYTFTDFEEDKEDKNKKSNEGEGSFFDDI